ncbi:MAG: hypothetical protein ABIG11_07115, partial [bacterium]
VPETYLEKAISNMYKTREARWAKAAARLGVQTFRGFHAYRGIRSPMAEEIIPQIIAAWQDPDSLMVQLSQHGVLSSWSLDRSVPERVARLRGMGILLAADIPLENTLADRIADGPAFSSLLEIEIIAGSVTGKMDVPKDKIEIFHKGRFYTYQTRQEFVDIWTADHPGTQNNP